MTYALGMTETKSVCLLTTHIDPQGRCHKEYHFTSHSHFPAINVDDVLKDVEERVPKEMMIEHQEVSKSPY